MSCWASIMPERRLLSATRVRAALLSRLTLATSITPTIPADTIASTRLKPRARRRARAIARRQWEGRWQANVFMGTSPAAQDPGYLYLPLTLIRRSWLLGIVHSPPPVLLLRATPLASVDDDSMLMLPVAVSSD